jgi:hypothetical protein
MKDLAKEIFRICLGISIVLILFFFVLKQCNHGGGTGGNNDTVYIVDTVIRIDTVTDTIRIDSIITKFYPIEVPPVELPPDIDCEKLAQDYYTIRQYNDTLINNDTVALFVLNESVTQNRVTERSFTYLNLRPKIVETIEITKTKEIHIQPHPQFGIGGSIGGNTDRFTYSVGTIYQPTKKVAIKGEYDVINKELRIGGYYMFNRK